MKTDLEVKNRVREILKMVQEVAPGKAVELRVPPYAAIQCREGKLLQGNSLISLRSLPK